ncbi:MAG TPA: ribosome maturation factor RimM, partial [Bdellovibrionota bacterium]|nr:ribosome maturation factor RimM [Bdellovibrionota bacterium]
AEALRGQEVVCREEDLPGLDENEFYSYQLIGLTVCTSEEELGVIKEVVSPAGQDILVVQGKEKQFLIPAVPEILIDVDLGDGIVTVDPPHGLLDTCSTKLSPSSPNVSQVPSPAE